MKRKKVLLKKELSNHGFSTKKQYKFFYNALYYRFRSYGLNIRDFHLIRVFSLLYFKELEFHFYSDTQNKPMILFIDYTFCPSGDKNNE